MARKKIDLELFKMYVRPESAVIKIRQHKPFSTSSHMLFYQ